jgi:4-hydroxy-tetrahydrodipicolinate synthase
MGTLPAMELYREAEDMGADAILAFNPQGFRSYSVKELIDHYLALTSAVKIHVAPYARGEDPIAFEVMKKLVDKGRVSYMKYAWRNPALLKEIAENIGDKLYIFCGADTFTLRYLLLGCKGVLTATAAILPKEHVELLAMVRKGRVEDARALYNDMITPWNDIGFYEMTVWQSVHKMALYHMGLIDSIKVVPPQSPADSYHADEVKFFLKRQGKLRRQ